MNRRMITALIFLCLATPALSQTTRTASDTREFILSPIAPPTPVLKYQFLFSYKDRRPGNAALKYMTAIEEISQAFGQQIDDASDALDEKKDNFKDLAEKLDAPGTLALLDLAAHCDQCDWEVPIREQGIGALLPYLQEMRQIANLLRVRAVFQARDGNMDVALSLIRLGYSQGRNISRCPVLVNGLVGLGIASLMNDALTEVMNQPNSPNLYWALASLPHPFLSFAENMQGEPASVSSSIPELARADLDNISPDQWRAIIARAASLGRSTLRSESAATAWTNSVAVADEVVRDLPKADEYYASAFHLSAADVNKLDPYKVVSTFWYQEYLNVADEQQAPANLPYPILIDRLQKLNVQILQLKNDEPLNPFTEFIFAPARAAETYSRLDRMIAALTDVEAIRSYAAAHGGALPARLEDITDTPALDNPRTGKPFDYHLDGDTATLSEPAPDNYPLTYTIRIRK